MKIVSSFALLLYLLSGTAYAYDTSGNYAVWGSGKKSCYGFKQDYAAGNTDVYKTYMKGFITAYNIFTEKTYSISGNMNENQIIEWLDAYCEDNPMASFESALTEFTFERYEDRTKSARSGAGGNASW